MKKISALFAAIALLLATANISLGADFELPDSSYEFYIYDETGTLSESLKDEIVSVNRSLESQTGAQIVVAVVEDTEGSSGAQEYANELFEEWKIGDAEEDNGVLFLVSLEERALWIEIGYGLEGALPDGKVGEIRDKYILPYFSEEDYEEGIRNGFYAIVEEVAEEYNITDLETQSPVETDSSGGPLDSIAKKLGVIGLVVLVILDMIFFRGMITFTLIRMFAGGRGSGGGGSGRGSGGGGSSGGGGAGGSW